MENYWQEAIIAGLIVLSIIYLVVRSVRKRREKSCNSCPVMKAVRSTNQLSK